MSTPTGSTAYAVAAGASMIHPSVPAIMVTPICPHSLSFRPIVVPAGVELKVRVVTGGKEILGEVFISSSIALQLTQSYPMKEMQQVVHPFSYGVNL